MCDVLVGVGCVCEGVGCVNVILRVEFLKYLLCGKCDVGCV